ncbi:hypothetical protein [Hyphomicrobium sp.]|jgi:hypothetical protein|uniref:hypothetical protein n=1 Tax=Hyphomicrobium sp. TaxID=82 RepID=UPI00356ADAFB
MVHTMVCRSFAAAGLVALAGCAQDSSGAHPAFIGLSDLAASSASANPQPADSGDSSDVLRHIQSNKVLGAMAFQKVTGQTVDPDSLIGHDNE